MEETKEKIILKKKKRKRKKGITWSAEEGLMLNKKFARKGNILRNNHLQISIYPFHVQRRLKVHLSGAIAPLDSKKKYTILPLIDWILAIFIRFYWESTIRFKFLKLSLM